MERNLKEALKHRRSYYAIDNQTTIPDAEIEEILDFAALHTPSAFNSQSTRMVLLLREQHRRLWDIVRNTLKRRSRQPLMLLPKQKSINRSQPVTVRYYFLRTPL